MHLYNSTSELQRRVVFGLDRAGIIDIAVTGARQIRELAAAMPETEIIYQYSPESFSGTELDFAVEICEAVMDVWRPTPEKKMIVNLPGTVEMATANIYADQIEWFARNVRDRDSLILSLHPHNDRGTAVAATEFGVMAGADRVEGTLFGNGERTGNVDVITLALNLFSQGIDPGLDGHRYRRRRAHLGILHATAGASAPSLCRRTGLHGVFRVASGRDQEGVRRAREAQRRFLGGAVSADRPEGSGPQLRGGDPGQQPVGQGRRRLCAEGRSRSRPAAQPADRVQPHRPGSRRPHRQGADQPRYLVAVPGYLSGGGGGVRLVDYSLLPEPRAGERRIVATVEVDGAERRIEGVGNGPIAAFVDALRRDCGIALTVLDYHENAVGAGADAQAAAYVQIGSSGVTASSARCTASAWTATSSPPR